MIRVAHAAALAAIAVLVGCSAAIPQPPLVQVVDRQVITPDEGTSVRELLSRAELALRQERWREAADAYRTLVAAARVGDDPALPSYLLRLGLAQEGLGDRLLARDSYMEVLQRSAASPDARTAVVRAIALDDYLEDWGALGRLAPLLLGRSDLDDMDRLTGLGARALAEVEAGDDGGAMRDTQQGLDLVERSGVGATGRLPGGAAQLRFALAEVRRVRSERLQLAPVTPDFLSRMNERCQGLLEAQSAFADAMRAMDPHWTAMSAVRIGEMYSRLHADLMAIPPTELVKTSAQRDLFFAMMHVRYRVLLEKGLEMMHRTVALGAQTSEVAPWVERATAAADEMSRAIEEEKAQLAQLPYTEETVQAALADLEKKTLAKQRPRAAGKP